VAGSSGPTEAGETRGRRRKTTKATERERGFRPRPLVSFPFLYFSVLCAAWLGVGRLPAADHGAVWLAFPRGDAARRGGALGGASASFAAYRGTGTAVPPACLPAEVSRQVQRHVLLPYFRRRFLSCWGLVGSPSKFSARTN
jgi:hypothetical protein